MANGSADSIGMSRSIGATISGSLFFREFARGLTGHVCICSAGNGTKTSLPAHPVTKHRDGFALPVATYETSRTSHFCDAFVGERGTLNLTGKAMSFPIVGIGASAGGLESISALLAGIPASTGMAYVFVQHLDPAHGSRLAKILSNRTALPVEEAREGEIFPDHLYVIIPNTTLTISNDVLRLRSRDPAERPHRPVDILFHSLAEKAECHWRYPLWVWVRRSKRYSSNQRGRWDYFRGGRKFCLLFWNAKQRHPNGMRGFCSSPLRHCARTNKHQPSSLSPKGQDKMTGKRSDR